jgi:linoleoyl-CoA desaturase
MRDKISYTRSEESDHHFEQLKRLVNQKLATVPKRPLGVAKLRALSFILLYGVFYGMALFYNSSLLLLCFFYSLMGIMIVFIFLNLVHEALHGNLFRSKKANRLILYFFDMIGANSYIFQKRHAILHHNFPNIAGWDSDIEQAYLFKIFPHDPQKPMHRVQHWTFAVFYPLYLVNWLFVRDFKDYFSRKQVIRKVCTSIPAREYVKLLFFKCFFILYTVLVPVYLGVDVVTAIGAMFLLLVVAGTFALFVLLTPHVNITNEFPLPDKDSNITGGWLSHQFRTTNDVSLNNWVTRNIMGNFNFHIAHHLFPHVSYVYAPQITEIIKSYAIEHDLSYRSHSMFNALRYHYHLVKRNAMMTDLFEEDM